MAATCDNTQRFRTQPLVIQPGLAARLWWLLRRAVIAAYEDNCFSIAKGAAYSFLLSLFPVLTTLTAILIQVREESIVRLFARFVSQVAPPGTEDLIFWRMQQHGRPVTLSIVAIALALWAGSGAMLSLMEGFQAAYRIPTGRHFLKQRAMAVLLVITAALPSVLASALIIFGDHSERSFVQWVRGSSEVFELSTQVEIAWRVVRYVLAFGTTTFVTGLLYYLGPNHRPQTCPSEKLIDWRFMRVWPGAILATVLWFLATSGFAWYVAHFGHYNIIYGSIWAVIVLLIWLYLIACIALIGCEFNAERERLDALPVRTNMA
jgi:membrane protein